MTKQSQELGTRGEDLAERLLKKKKFRILKRNLKTKLGEIDILAQDGRTLVVVEVKTKTDERLGSPLEMITPKKQHKLILLAHELSVRYRTNNVRIDVVGIDAPSQGHEPIVRHYKGIVEYNG